MAICPDATTLQASQHTSHQLLKAHGNLCFTAQLFTVTAELNTPSDSEPTLLNFRHINSLLHTGARI